MYVGYECNYNIEKSIENKIQIGREGDDHLQIVFSLYIWLIYICDSNLRESKKEKKPAPEYSVQLYNVYNNHVQVHGKALLRE